MSKVYFIDFSTGFRKKSYPSQDIISKLDSLFIRSGLLDLFKEKELGVKPLVACKLHFGERGNTGFVKPVFVKKIVEIIKLKGGLPFLTDTNSLYVGERGDAPSHIRLAAEHGFNGAPIIIADGLRGEEHIKVKSNGKHFNELKIASSIYYADIMIVISHFKGHYVTGFGGALKNLGMGCASKAGKLEQHSSVSPWVGDECTGCGACKRWCPADAIKITDVAKILSSKCIGCAVCISVCKIGAIKINWEDVSVQLQERMIEYAKGAVTGKRVGYINFITDVTPLCDCWGSSDPPVVPDIGILASLDPVSIDAASFDLVNKASLGKFGKLHPSAEPEVQLNYAEQIGLGTQKYKLIKV
ncbi:MAG: DUF362 domain-containing protein [bacterium]|nr:DUF362 domain-containing protein [bacterium]